MTLRLRNTSEVAKIFGITSVGSFANNTALKNNPEIIKLLITKQARRKSKKKYTKTSQDYYKKLLAKSEQIRAERSEVTTSVEPVKINRISEEKNANPKISAHTVEVLDSQEFGEELPNLYWESENNRYYHASVEQNLFGSYSLIKSWGGTNNKLGNYKTTFFDSLEEAVKAIKVVIKQRQYKRYKLRSGSNLLQETIGI